MTTDTIDPDVLSDAVKRTRRLAASPLDLIAEDHLQMRVACADLDRLATQHSPSEATLCDMLSYLRHDLTQVLGDEDETLLPLVLVRAEPDDDMPALLARLARDHEQILSVLSRVISGLEQASLSQIISWDLRDDLRLLANATRRHLILENAVLLPLARTRLTPADLAQLEAELLRRRGLDRLLTT